MLKKLLSFIALFSIAISLKSSAQCTIDNSYTTSGYYPASIPDAMVNQLYDQTVQVVIPKDTQVVVQGFTITATIAEVYIDSISGLPDGISYSCNPGNCIFPGNSNNCIQLSGTPTTTGFYPLKVYYRTKTSQYGTFAGDEGQYSLTVNAVTSVESTITNASLAFANVITLGGNKNEIQFYSSNQKVVTLEVYNILGTLSYTQKLKANAGLNKNNLLALNLKSGVYIVSLSDGSTKISKRVAVN